MDDLVTAQWCGPFVAVIPGVGIVEPGDTVEMPAGQAQESAHWTVVSGQPTFTPPAPPTFTPPPAPVPPPTPEVPA